MSRSVFIPFASTLLVSSLAVAMVGCNKKPAPSTATPNSTSSTTTTATTETTVVSSAISATSATSATADSSVPTLAVNSATSATSAPATTQIQGNPKEVVKSHIEALRTGNIKNAVTYVQATDPKPVTDFLTQNAPQYKNLKSVTYAEPQYNPEKTQAQVVATFTGKALPQPLKVPYLLVATPKGWKILANVPTKNPTATKDGKVDTKLMTAQEAATLKANGGKPALTKDKNGKVVATLPAQATLPHKPRTAPIVVEKTKKGTPEDTVKQAMNTLMTGTPKESTKFYISKNPKLEQVVASQQAIFQQNLQAMKLGEIKYNKNKTQADVNVLLIPLAPQPMPTKTTKPVKATKKSTEKATPVPPPQPQAGVIKLEKKGGVWKILAD